MICRAVVLVVVQTEERNMYDQHWLFTLLKERYPFRHVCATFSKFDTYNFSAIWYIVFIFTMSIFPGH